jgi:hypothetical protein
MNGYRIFGDEDRVTTCTATAAPVCNKGLGFALLSSTRLFARVILNSRISFSLSAATLLYFEVNDSLSEALRASPYAVAAKKSSRPGSVSHLIGCGGRRVAMAESVCHAYPLPSSFQP